MSVRRKHVISLRCYVMLLYDVVMNMFGKKKNTFQLVYEDALHRSIFILNEISQRKIRFISLNLFMNF